MQIFPIKDDFPPRFYDEFARLIVTFGRIEYLIKLCVKDLLAEGFTQGMTDAESQRQFSELCKKAKQEAGNKLSQTQARDFSKLIEQAEALAEFRNDSVHALWTTDANGQPLRIRPKWAKTTRTVDWSRSHVVLLSEVQSNREQIERLYQLLEVERRTWATSTTLTDHR